MANCFSQQNTHPCRNILEKRLWLVLQREKSTILKTCTTFILSCISRQRSYTQYILETKRNSFFVLYIRKNDVAECFSQQSTHACRTILEKRLWLVLQREKSTILKTCTTFILSCISRQRSYTQYILETKRNSFFVLYIQKNDVANCFSQQSTHPCRNILEKRLWLVLQREKSTILKTCTTFILSCISRQRSYTQYILETKRNSFFVLYIRKNDVAECFSQQSTHACRTILEKKAVVSIAKRIVYNS